MDTLWILTWTQSPSKCGSPVQIPHFFSPNALTPKVENKVPFSDWTADKRRASHNFSLTYVHKRDVHMTRSSPIATFATSRWFTLKCSHLQVFQTPANSRCPPPSVSHQISQFTQHKRCFHTRGCVGGASALRQLRSCLLDLDLEVRCWTWKYAGRRQRAPHASQLATLSY